MIAKQFVEPIKKTVEGISVKFIFYLIAFAAYGIGAHLFIEGQVELDKLERHRKYVRNMEAIHRRCEPSIPFDLSPYEFPETEVADRFSARERFD